MKKQTKGSFFKDWEKAIRELDIEPKKKESSPPFKCRICGCENYEGVYGNSNLVPLGGHMYPIAYQCCGCSVIFKNISKFSITVDVVPPLTHEV